MDSRLGPGIVLTLWGILMLAFHRKIARSSAVFYQTAPEMQERMLEWFGLLGGAWAIIMGIASFAYPDIPSLASVIILAIGFFSIFFSDWSARRTLVRYQSVKYWRNLNLLIGLAATAIGVLRVAHLLDCK